ncbi:hypothetical protein TNCV_2377351 [Trichonephila clavipes]|nr:hypothetical protein TNCV_2377351 [Trichonephila clavipes]
MVDDLRSLALFDVRKRFCYTRMGLSPERFTKQSFLSPVPYSYGLEINVDGVQPLKYWSSSSSTTHRFEDLICCGASSIPAANMPYKPNSA